MLAFNTEDVLFSLPNLSSIDIQPPPICKPMHEEACGICLACEEDLDLDDEVIAELREENKNLRRERWNLRVCWQRERNISEGLYEEVQELKRELKKLKRTP